MFVKVLPPDPAPPPVPHTTKTDVEFLLTLPLEGVDVNPIRSSPLDLKVGVVALTKQLQEAAEFSQDVRGRPQSGDMQNWVHNGIRIKEHIELAAGSYDLRFFTRDNNAGRIGTVVFPIDVK